MTDINGKDLNLNNDNEMSVCVIFAVIRKTCPCSGYPLKPHFYILTGVCRGIPIFLIFALKHRLWVLVRTASPRRF